MKSRWKAPADAFARIKPRILADVAQDPEALNRTDQSRFGLWTASVPTRQTLALAAGVETGSAIGTRSERLIPDRITRTQVIPFEYGLL